MNIVDFPKNSYGEITRMVAAIVLDYASPINRFCYGGSMPSQLR